ncbi:MAG: MinD/ParA family protein [Algisphaera sp.]
MSATVSIATDQASALRELSSRHAAAQRLAPNDAFGNEPAAQVLPERTARTLAITSGKGGVGKTSMTVNLAIQLTRLGRRVVLLDADLGTANADVICNVRASRTIAHLIAGQCSIEDILIDAPGGFKLVPGASGLAHMAHLDAVQMHRLTHEMRRLEATADIILIDTGAGVGPGVLGFCAAAERILVVTTPEPTAITDAYALIKTVNTQMVSPDIQLLVNMVRDEAQGRAVFNRIAGVTKQFLSLSPSYAGCVTRDEGVPRAVCRRRPFVLDAPRGRAASDVLALAHGLDRHAAVVSPEPDGLWTRLAGWFGR